LIEFSLLVNQSHSARSWFEVWSERDPENPQLDVFREGLQKIGA